MQTFSREDGAVLVEGYPWSHKGILYPANWLNFATADEMKAVGVQESKFDSLTQIISGPDQSGAFSIADKDLVTVQSQFIGAVKQAASGVILSAYPDWKQRNMTARAVDLLSKTFDKTISPDEQAEVAQLQAAWAWIKSVRAHSNVLEAEVNGASALSDLAAWQAHGWPIAP